MTDGNAEPRPLPSDAAAARRLHPGRASHPPLDRLTALARRILGTGSAQVSLVSDVASVVGSAGVPTEHLTDLPLADSLCARTALQQRPLIVTDTRSDPTTAALPGTAAGLIGSFLGVPVRADDGSAVGALCVFDPAPRLWAQEEVGILQALADSAAAELELAALTRDFDASRARWDLAIESAGVGTFDWDLRTGRLSWDQTLIDMFGYGGDDVFEENIASFNARLHPDDRAPVGQALQTAIETVGDFEAEYRVVLPDGRVRDLQARGRALGTDGVADRLLGAAWDVSATRGSEDRATRIIEAMPVAYVRIDPLGTVLATNQLAERLLRANRMHLTGRVLWDAVPETRAIALDEISARVVLTGNASIDEVHLPAPIDAWLELGVWPDGAGLSLFFTDITQRRRARAVAEQLAAHDRRVAEALQDALLTRLPERDHLELRARYVTAADGDRVGGDWYDAVLQPDGATVLVVGDVVGHDIAAAATMGQLRSMLRAFLWQTDTTPAQAMTILDRAMHDLYPGALATVVTARLEQDEAAFARGVRTLRWSNGGHLPPIVVGGDGASRILHARHDLLLGVQADRARHDHVVELAAGTVLALYTDGLVERRGHDIDAGIERLAAAVRRHNAMQIDEMIDAVLDDMLDDDVDDDVVLFLARLNPQS